MDEDKIYSFDITKDPPQAIEVDKEHILYGDSVTKDTLILTGDESYIKIEDLFKEVTYRIGNKEYYVPSEEVLCLSYDWKQKACVFKPIRYVMRHKTDKKVYRVQSNNITYVDVTEDHSVISSITTKNATKEVIQEVRNGEREPFLVKKPVELDSSIFTYSYITKERDCYETSYPEGAFFEFLGFFVGDGSYKNRKVSDKQVSLSFGLDLHEGIDRIVTKLQKENYVSGYCVSNNGYDVTLYFINHYKNISDFYDCEMNKIIPKWMFNQSEEDICSFIRGLFSADGTVYLKNKKPTIRLSSNEFNVLKSVKYMLALVGIGSSIYAGNTMNDFNGVYSNTYQYYLTIHNDFIEDFRDKIGFIFERKQNRIAHSSKTKSNKADGLTTIRSNFNQIKEIEYDDYVYDIEVEDTHLFFANDILVHNTDSIGVDGSFVFDENATVDEVVDFGNRIADTTNERFPEFLQTVFNVQSENTRFLKTERESAFSKAFFQAKKRYFQLIVDDEGDRVDHKEKIMGLEIKKTSASQVTREYLYKLCRCILDEGTREAALDLVDRLHEDFYNRSLQEIATPTTVKTLNAYERGQKNIPWHVKAAMAYNDLCGPNDPQIRSGDKIKVINVDPKHQKTEEPIKRIAFPIDVDNIPSFVYDFRINWQVEWEKVEKYLNNYLASMGWDKQSYQKDHTNNLFSIQ